jgi:hypothetical protein
MDEEPSQCEELLANLIHNPNFEVDEIIIETMGSSPELATWKSTITPNTCPMIMYLNNISVNPDFENIS